MRENNECKQYAMDAIKINLNYRIVTYNQFWSLYISNNNITINNNNIQLSPEGEVNSGGYIPRREASRYIFTALHRP